MFQASEAVLLAVLAVACAFVTNEAIGSTRGTVDVIDLGARARVASAERDFQPGGIDCRGAPR
jgi:hypothetical protein